MRFLADTVAVDPSDAVSQVNATLSDVLPYVLTLAIAGIAMMLVRRWLMGEEAPESMTEGESYAEMRMYDDMEREDEVGWAETRQRLFDEDGERWVYAVEAAEDVPRHYEGGCVPGCDCAWCEHGEANQ